MTQPTNQPVTAKPASQWLRQALQRLRSSFADAKMDQDLDAEMAAHLDLAIEENLERGMSPDEARRQALIRFGGVDQARQQQREARGLPMLDVLWQDVRFTLRSLRRDRGFALVAVSILAIGIGANIAVFSVVNTILLEPLPFRDPQRLIWISGAEATKALSKLTYSVDAYDQFRRQSRSFEDITGYFAFSTADNYQLMNRGEIMPISGINVIGNFFQTLGVNPSLGRLFTAEECLKNGPPAVLLGHAFWKRRFTADPQIVGKAITLNGQPVTVVGVLPETLDFGAVFSPGSKVDIYTPAPMEDMRDWGNTLSLIGRLNPGIGVAQAQAEANTIVPQLLFNLKYPQSFGHYTAKLTVLKEYVSGKLRRSLIVLWCAVGMILLIVCVNLSNLMLARAAARSKEFAMRTALGAGRGRLIRQLLTESLVFAGAGAVLGLGLALLITSYLAHQGSIALPLLSSVKVNGTVLAWTLLVTVAAAGFSGLAPGLRMSRKDLQAAIKDGGQGMSEGKKHDRIRAALVISELALACVLLIGAGLLLRSFLRVLDVDLGFEPSRAAALKIQYKSGSAPQRGSALQEILQRVLAIPGIEAAGVSDNLPLDMNRTWGLSAKGKEYSQGELPGSFVYVVTPGYLRAMGIQLLEGRDFGWQDGETSENVIIINRTAARRLWPGADALGRIAMVNSKETRVVGIIADVRESSLESTSGWQMYLPVTQVSPVGAELAVRTKLAPDLLAGSVMSTLRSLNPTQPATEFRPLQQLVDHAVSPRRFFVLLVAAFAGLGLVLASLGIYGMISYSVTRQTQEIGIRMALGATAARVQFGVIAKTLRLALIGITLGTVASFVAAKGIASLLFGTDPSDPAAYLGMILLLGSVALIAGYIPARRASQIDPMIALRNN
jgi:predicted permease